MYAVAPLGFNPKFPNRPWLHGSAVDLFMVLIWILLFGAPLVAGAIAGWRCDVPDDPGEASAARARQGFAAGLVSGGVGALFVTVLGAGTTALLVKSAWVRDWLYHAPHLTASAVYGRELFATQDVSGYFLLLVGFLLIGLRDGRDRRGDCQRDPPAAGRGRVWRPRRPAGARAGAGSPDGGRRADAGGDQDRLLGRYDDGEGEGDQGPARPGRRRARCAAGRRALSRRPCSRTPRRSERRQGARSRTRCSARRRGASGCPQPMQHLAPAGFPLCRTRRPAWPRPAGRGSLRRTLLAVRRRLRRRRAALSVLRTSRCGLARLAVRHPVLGCARLGGTR